MLLVIGVVPVTAMTQEGAGIFRAPPYACVIWTGLVILAVVGVLVKEGLIRHWNPDCGSPLLLTMPIAQALVFLASQRLFRHAYGRSTVPFSVAKNQRDSAGQVRWGDIGYWAVFGYFGTGLSFLLALRAGLKILT